MLRHTGFLIVTSTSLPDELSHSLTSSASAGRTKKHCEGADLCEKVVYSEKEMIKAEQVRLCRSGNADQAMRNRKHDSPDTEGRAV